MAAAPGCCQAALLPPCPHLRPAFPCFRAGQASTGAPSATRSYFLLHQGGKRERPDRHVAAASSGGGGGGDAGEEGSESAESAFNAVQSCMDLFMSRQNSSDLDSLVEYLPEAVIDRLLERKRAKLQEAGEVASSTQQEDLSFDELVALAQPSDLALDAYSSRGLLNAPPRSAAVLSSLKLAPDRFLQRYEVITQSGEEMCLTFDMQLEESLQPKYRGLQVVKKWFLKGITGEPAYPGELPAKPEPCWGPDAVVLAQLEALQQGDAAGVFRFASPSNQAATGPVQVFAEMLQTPSYRPLLGHHSADLLRTVQMQPDVALLIVGVRSNIPTSEPGVTQRVVYSWTVRLQGEEAGPECRGCWMTEAVQPLSQNLFKM